MAATAVATSPVASLACLTVAIMGGFGVQGVLYAMFGDALARAGGGGLAGALATITTVGNLGGFVGPYAVGLMLVGAGTFHLALLAIAASFAVAGLLTLAVRDRVSSRPGAVARAI